MNFKVGDWVEVKDPTELLPHQKEVFKIEAIVNNSNLFGIDYATEYGNSRYFSLWQPKEGEWCWFTIEMDEGDFEHPTLMGYGEHPNLPWIIEPFRGTLPSFIKETK